MRQFAIVAVVMLGSLCLVAGAGPAGAQEARAAGVWSSDAPADAHAFETLGAADLVEIPRPPTDPFSDPSPAPPASRAIASLAVRIVDTGDNDGLPFIIVDKPSARVLVFEAGGQLVGLAPALLGVARGDDAAPGVGDLAISRIPMDERTTEAGRFLARLGPAKGMDSVLWVNFDTSLSLHAVITSNPRERRLQRLNSPSPDDRRITHGCINVPTDFYRDVVQKTFAGTAGVVYILPDTKPLDEVFADLGDAGRRAPTDETSSSLDHPWDSKIID